MKRAGTDAVRLKRRAVLASVVTTAVVATIELSVGWTFDLLSIVAEGLHTAIDLLTSLVSLASVILAARPADRAHPYGHGKVDSIAGTFEGLCVAGSGVWVIYRALQVLLGHATLEPRPGVVALVAMGAASVLYFFVSRSVLRAARQTGSPTVYAEGVHLQTHIYVTAALFLGVGLSAVGYAAGWSFAGRIDPILAIGLGVVLIGLGARIVWTGARQLLDTALPAEELAQITACLNEFRDEFVEVHSIRTRQAGSAQHVDIHLVVTAETTVRDAHDLAHRIEARVIQDLPEVSLLVHIEPAVGEMLRRYADRGWAGVVFAERGGSTEDEAAHHRHTEAHRG